MRDVRTRHGGVGGRLSTIVIGVALAGLVLSATTHAQEYAQRPVDRANYFPMHGNISLLPWENIDTFTGNVTITIPLFDLPGNGRSSLQLTAVVNSKRDATGGRALPVGGLGPYEVARYDDPNISMHPFLMLADGGVEHTFLNDDGYYYTASYWRLHVTEDAALLDMPDGTTYRFEEKQVGTSYLLTDIEDAFGNHTRVNWSSDGTPRRLETITQELGAGQQRVIRFDYGESGALQTLEDESSGRRWQFAPGTLTPPEGPPWRVEWTWPNGGYEIRVTTPEGGWVSYRFEPGPYPPPDATYIALTTRTAGGPGIDGGTWVFDPHGTNFGGVSVTVTGPCSVVTHTYESYGDGTSALSSVTTSGGGTSEEVSARWIRLPAVGPWDPWYQRQYPDDTEMWPDPRPLRVESVTTTRTTDGDSTRAYTRTYFYRGNDDFGHPTRLAETGDFVRTTDYEYWTPSDDPYLGGLPKKQTLEPGTFEITYTFDGQGFLTGKTTYGVPVSYTPTASGNVGTQTDGNGHTTSFTYAWGVVANTTTPEYTITRSINPDGTVASETRRGFTTTFGYDGLGRQRRREPPLGSATVTDYFYEDTDGDGVTNAAVRVSRQNTSVTTSLDGFGRPVLVTDSRNAKTRTRYDACGRTEEVTRPFIGSESSTLMYAYDALGRLTQETDHAPGEDPEHTIVTHVYDRMAVTITDQLGRQTVHRFEASGDPDRARLRSVTDARGNTTSYEYNALNQLTRVVAPVVNDRWWEYWPGTPLLHVEHHPEAQGADITYTYNGAGLLETRTQSGRTWSYTYDGNNRVQRIQREGADDLTFAWDASDNRTLLTTGNTRSVFEFDAANRLASREDRVTGVQYTTRYEYTGDDMLGEIRYPGSDDLHVRYEYGPENLVSRVYPQAGDSYAREFDYTPSGALSAYKTGNDVTHSIDYDGRQRVRRTTAGPTLDLEYGYTSNGNVETITEHSRTGMDQTFMYDDVDRLTRATGFWKADNAPGVLTFGYDEAGNRTWQDLDDYTQVLPIPRGRDQPLESSPEDRR